MLSTQLLEILRAYWRWRKPQEWLFPSARFADRPLDFSSIRKMCKEAGERAGLGKCLHPHALRHASAYYTTFRKQFIPKRIAPGQWQFAEVYGHAVPH